MEDIKAIDIMKQNGIDIVLMDIKMPVMNGVETYKKMKELMPDTPVIMITAYAVEELIQESLQDGAFGFIRKPLDFDKLLDMIENAVHKGSMILVVDDDENLCKNMKNILNDRGYRVSVAQDGSTAIKKTEENNFDVILLDMNLPPLNGLETYLAIREKRPNATVIIITGYLEEMKDKVEAAMEKCVYTCIEKPVQMEELISLLENIGEQKKKGILKKPK